MVARKHLVTRGIAPARPCAVCLERYTFSLGTDSAVHQSAAQCEAWMRAHEGRGCSNPREHHAYEPAPITRRRKG